MADPLSVDEVLSIADELEAGWQRAISRDLDVSREQLARATCVLGLATHTTALLEVVAKLQRDNTNPVTLMPLIRTAFECAITSQWLAQVKDGVEAWINTNTYETGRLLKNLRESGSTSLRDAADGIEAARMTARMTSASDHQAKVFRAMCADLAPADNEAYAYYQVLCGFTHATVNVADEYFVLDESGGPMFAPGSKFTVSSSWLYLAAVSAVWAQMAAQMVISNLALRDELTAVANVLGISPTLALVDGAHKRTAGGSQGR